MTRRDPLPDLSDRERRVLQALIDAHIASAEPVGSKTLAEVPEIGVSAATVRNVLSALAEQGLIDQPHTSAGRIPTDRGLRYYVDTLLELHTPSRSAEDEIHNRIHEAADVDEAMREASRVLSRLAKQTSLVLTLRPESAPIRHVELLRLRDDAVLLIVVTAEGKVQNRLLDWRTPEGQVAQAAPTSAELASLSKQLMELIEGFTLEEGHQRVQARLRDVHAELSALEDQVLRLASQGLQTGEPASVHVEGTAHLLRGSTDLQAVKRTQDLLALLEEHDRVRAVLAQAVDAPGVRIFIGDEIYCPPPHATSLHAADSVAQTPLMERGMVMAPLGARGSVGVLGVIGPRHLDYARVVPLVDLTAQVVSRVLSGSGAKVRPAGD